MTIGRLCGDSQCRAGRNGGSEKGKFAGCPAGNGRSGFGIPGA
ncbi:hypothetical protein RSSM_03259 [Rhodopirellula sallentina SM41]|uniref:Uncharacterized protein n=1 Tax=Rhodopirellula sallentina SM41 TaxID=1263870 RepID=M5U1I0_9BACT|nr:hypothetical protein RSSM_03259 [Rhodopirellula sallentina SM41]